MFFKRNKIPEQPKNNPPPPWENIDKVPDRRPASTSRIRFNITGFIEQVTGFGKIGSRMLLLGFAIAIGFIAYAIYTTSKQGPPLPVDVNRPAIDKNASSTIRLTPNLHP